MEPLFHRSPSVGTVVKKLLALNPELSAAQIIDFIKQSTYSHGEGEFGRAEMIDQEKALGLARSQLNGGSRG